MAEVTPTDLLKKLRDDLAPWVAERKGALSIAGDPSAVLEALMDGPRSFRVVLHWAGDADQTEQHLAGIVDHQLEVWLIKAKGLKLNPGDLLIVDDGDLPPYLVLLEQLRAYIRGTTFPADATSQILHYKGTAQVDPLTSEIPTAAYKLSFELTAALAQPEYRF